MLSEPVRYLARVFGRTPDTSPKARDFMDFCTALGEDFVPSPLQEMPGISRVRLGARSLDSARVVEVRGESIDFEWRRTSISAVLPFDDFLEQAARMLANAAAHLKVQGHRVAAIQEGLLKETTSAEFDAVARRLLNVPQIGSDELFEWDWRVALRVARSLGSAQEKTNTIAIVRRLQAKLFDAAPQDRLFASLDINTVPENLTPRFSSGGVEEFFSAARSWHAEFARQVLEFCGGVST